jgi:hypothetical protein
VDGAGGRGSAASTASARSARAARGRSGSGTRSGLSARGVGPGSRGSGRGTRGARGACSAGAGGEGRSTASGGASTRGTGSLGSGRGVGRSGGAGDSGAGQVVQRLGGQRGTNETEAGVGGGALSILENVPPGVDLVEEEVAADVVPVGLGVLNRSNTLALGLTADWPAGLSDPDGLVTRVLLDVVHGFLEQRLAVRDVVVVGVLEVGVGINAEPVAGINDRLVGGVGPGSPGVDVADGGILQASSRDGGADGLDVFENGVRALANASLGGNASGRVTVQILTADRDTDNQFGELVSVGGNGRLQGSNLVVKGITRGPETEKKSSLFLDSGVNGSDGSVGSTTLL